MSPTEQDLKGLVTLLHTIRTSQQIKLRFGAMQRQELRDRLANGGPADGYRAEWIKDSRDKLVKMLGTMAQEFNAKYPHDCASVTDLGDICSAVLHYLKRVQES